MLPQLPVAEEDTTLVQSRLITRSNLLLRFQALGFSLDTGGNCGGLTSKYLLEKGMGEAPLHLAKLRRLSHLQRADYKREQDAFNNLAKDILMLQDPTSFSASRIQQGDLDRLPPQSNRPRINRQYTLGLRWPTDNLEELFGEVLKDGDMVYMATIHAVAAYKRFGIYYLYDPNSKDGEDAFTDLAEFTKHARKYLFIKDNQQNTDVMFKMFRYEEKGKNISAPRDYPSKAALLDKIPKQSDPGYTSTFQIAAAANDVEMCRELLNRGADPFAIGSDDTFYPQKSPLYTACAYSSMEVIRLILDRPVNVPANHLIECLFHLLAYCNPEVAGVVLEYLNQKYPDHLQVNIKGLFTCACYGRSLKIIERLLELDKTKQLQNPDVVVSGFKTAVEKNSAPIVRFLLDRHHSLYPLLNESRNFAIKNGYHSVYVELAKNLGKPGPAEVLLAITESQPLTLTHMLMAGAEINSSHIVAALNVFDLGMVDQLTRNEPFKTLNEAMKGNVEQCRNLLRLQLVSSETLLLAALVSQRDDFANALRGLGVSIRRDSPEAGKQLALAAQRGDFAVVRSLLEAGVNPDQTLEVTNDKNEKERRDLFRLVSFAWEPDLYPVILNHYRNPDPDAHKLASVLTYACYFGHIPTLNALRPFNINLDSGLQTALDYHHPDAIIWLLRNGAKPDREFIMALGKTNYGDALIEMFANNSFASYLCRNTPEILTSACERGHAHAMNALLENGAVFIEPYRMPFNYKGPIYRLRLSQAYGIDPDVATDSMLLQYASMNKHEAVIQFLTRQQSYMQELEARGQRELNMQIRLYAAEKAEERSTAAKRSAEQSSPAAAPKEKRSKHKLFKWDSQTALAQACRRGSLRDVKHLMAKNKIDFSTYVHRDDLLSITAERIHLDVLGYLVALLNQDQLAAHIKVFMKSHSYQVVAAILEVTEYHKLAHDPKLLALLDQHKTDLDTRFRASLNTNDPEGSKSRQANVTEEHNALGMILHGEYATNSSPKTIPGK